jgi:hypothetical protein
MLSDGVDAFVFDDDPLIVSVLAFWDRGARSRTTRRP